MAKKTSWHSVKRCSVHLLSILAKVILLPVGTVFNLEKSNWLKVQKELGPDIWKTETQGTLKRRKPAVYVREDVVLITVDIIPG